MATPSSVSALMDAIKAFRKECGDDDDCERIVVLADACETEIERAYPDEEKREKSGDSDEPEDVPRDKQPKTLTGARDDVKARMARVRETARTYDKKQSNGTPGNLRHSR